MFHKSTIIKFSELRFEITNIDKLHNCISNNSSEKKMDTKHYGEHENFDYVMNLMSDESVISILFSKKIPISDLLMSTPQYSEIKDNENNCIGNITDEYRLDNNKLLLSDYRIIKPTTSSPNDIPIYLSVTDIKHKRDNNSYLEFFINLYDKNDNNIGMINITPNSNILIPKSLIQKVIGESKNIDDISYLKLSMMVSGKCQFNLNFFTFSFVDNMSNYIYSSKDFGVNIRLQVNNIQKKKNGVVILFPSFYVQEVKSDNLANYDCSVKWPNYTRHSWNSDLDKYCTIYVSDPFQYINGNYKSSWFVAPNGKSILPEIAKYIRNLLELDNAEKTFRLFNSFLSKNLKHHCGPIINYGSSMGGFAAFLFSCYLEPTICFIECPQANILNYKFSVEYLAKHTCLKTRFKKVRVAIGKFLEKDRDKKKRYFFAKIANSNDLSFSAILRNHNPKFRTLIHYYSLDKQHLLSFNNEISLLSDNERRSFNYQLIVENDIENQLFTHQAMPKDKVLEIFRTYLSKKR